MQRRQLPGARPLDRGATGRDVAGPAAEPWPGNICELKNVIERAVLLCAGNTIEPEHLPGERMGARLVIPAPRTPAPAPGPGTPASGTPERAAARAADPGDERERIIAALAACAGNQTQAAVLLGIKRRRLVALLERYDLPRPRRR